MRKLTKEKTMRSFGQFLSAGCSRTENFVHNLAPKDNKGCYFSGFSLIELLVAMAISGILIMLTSTALLPQAQRLSRYQVELILQRGLMRWREHAALGNKPEQWQDLGLPQQVDNYNFQVLHQEDGTALQALPKGASADKHCGALTLSQDGQLHSQYNEKECVVV